MYCYQIARCCTGETEMPVFRMSYVDGGPTRNDYLMQFQSNTLQMLSSVPDSEELSAITLKFVSYLILFQSFHSLFCNTLSI